MGEHSDQSVPQIDPEVTNVRFEDEISVSRHDLANLESLGIATNNVEERDGEIVMTECRIDLERLVRIAADADTLERQFGDRWKQTGWNPPLNF